MSTDPAVQAAEYRNHPHLYDGHHQKMTIGPCPHCEQAVEAARPIIEAEKYRATIEEAAEYLDGLPDWISTDTAATIIRDVFLEELAPGAAVRTEPEQ